MRIFEKCSLCDKSMGFFVSILFGLDRYPCKIRKDLCEGCFFKWADVYMYLRDVGIIKDTI